MSESIFISPVYFQIIQDYIEHMGLEHLFSNSQRQQLVELTQNQNKQALSFFNQYLKILLDANISSQLFLDLANYFEIKHYGLVGYISIHAKNFKESAEYIEKFCSLMIELDHSEQIKFTISEFESQLSWPLWNSQSIWINEINLAAIFKITQQLTNHIERIQFTQIEFAHTPLMPLEHYQRFYACPVIFNASQYSFNFNNRFLDYKLSSSDEVLLNILLTQAEQLLVQTDSSKSNLERKLQFIVQKYLELGESIPEIHIIAASFHMSKRNFQRKLKADNIVFRQYIEHRKILYCQHLLKTSNKSLTDIALQLGYADQSSLGRAFKKNVGISLSAYIAE